MLQTFLILSLALSTMVVATANEETKGQIWAVLVAGSNGYDNYRHQADLCHAYQIFHRHGVPDSNIIVMMYDDIAHNAENPRPGVIINKPNGPNVYGPKAVPKDYTGEQVTPKNFVKVLTGDKKGMEGVGSGKVLLSGPNDHVFINFVDHGGTGLIAFPNSYMYADDLMKTLKEMHKKRMYKKLVFYMEACESGSMFNKLLPSNIDIFVTTAADPYESSYACYYDEKIGTYLGDEYSVSWMEDIDSEEHHKNITTETLKKQYHDVIQRVQQSHPSMYGEKTMQKDHVKDFIGISKETKTVLHPPNSSSERFKDSVSSREVVLHSIHKNLQLSTNAEEKIRLQKRALTLLKGRRKIDELLDRILSLVTGGSEEDQKALKERQPLSLSIMTCYRTLVDTFNNQCVNINKNTYVLRHLYKFANICATKHPATEHVLQAFKEQCGGDSQALTDID